jgi:hypothetical protein
VEPEELIADPVRDLLALGDAVIGRSRARPGRFD